MGLRICYGNDIERGSVSASSQISSLPASNVKDYDIQKIWRASANSADLLWDAGQVSVLGFVTAVNSNATLASSFQVRASLTDPTVVGSLSYNSNVLPGIDPVFGKFVHFPSSAISYRYGRLTITQSEPPEVGRLEAGIAWQPSRHMSLVDPPEALAEDPSRQSLSIGQNVFVDELEPKRGYRFIVRGITDAERFSQVDEINRLRGRRKDILVCVDDVSPNLGRDAYWGLLHQNIAARRIPDLPGFWEITLEQWERL